MTSTEFQFEDYVIKEFFREICDKLNEYVGSTLFKVNICDFDDKIEFYISGSFNEHAVIVDCYDCIEDDPLVYYNGFNVYTTTTGDSDIDEYVSASNPYLKEIIIDLALECIMALETDKSAGLQKEIV